MQLRRIKTATAFLAVAAGVSAFAGSAQAAVVDNYGFSMWGNPDLQFSDGNMAFDWEHSVTSGHLTGTMKVIKNGNNASFRVALQSYDINNKQIGDTVYDDADGTPVHTNGSKDIPVDMDAVSGPGVTQVKVLLQKKGTTDKFITKDYTYATVLTHPDDVTILGSGIDVGGWGFDTTTGEPTAPATVWWKIGADGQLTANYHGWLDLDSIFYRGVGRVEIRAINNAGKVLATADGPAHQLTTPAFEPFEDTLSVTTADAIRLKVKMQTQGTDPYTGDPIWLDAGEQIVTVAE
jgi:hypothetical protein